MTTNSGNEAGVWFTEKDLKEHVDSFGKSEYDKLTQKAKGKSEFDQLPSLVKQLWEDDKSGPLTNQAAREIERLREELQKAVNERNEAWCQLEEKGVEIRPVES